MKHPQLTKSSSKELYGWHAGSGYLFLSEGTGKSIKMMDVRLFRRESGVYLTLGNSKVVKLTAEQEAELGMFAVEDVD